MDQDVQATERTYEQRYCAFLDILGFTELIGGIERGRVRFEEVRDLLKIIHRPSKLDSTGLADFRATTISDAIVLSTSHSVDGLAVIVDIVTNLTLSALEKGYFARGGVCRGSLYHDDDMVFGDAFINAYRLESSIARYPRVVIAKQVYDEAINSNLRPYFLPHLGQADDGPYFIDVLEQIKIELAVMDSGSVSQEIVARRLDSLTSIRAWIERRLDEAVDNPSHFEKAQWFARYWNDSFGATETRTGRVNGPGLGIAKWRHA